MVKNFKSNIEIEGITFEVDFDFFPEEKQVNYYKDGTGHPGAPAEVEINDIRHKGTDFTEFFREKGLMDEVEEIAWDEVETYFDLMAV